MRWMMTLITKSTQVTFVETRQGMAGDGFHKDTGNSNYSIVIRNPVSPEADILSTTVLLTLGCSSVRSLT